MSHLLPRFSSRVNRLATYLNRKSVSQNKCLSLNLGLNRITSIFSSQSIKLAYVFTWYFFFTKTSENLSRPI